jgi:hypothetical protein
LETQASQFCWRRDHKTEEQQNETLGAASITYIILSFMPELWETIEWFYNQRSHNQTWPWCGHIFQRDKLNSGESIRTLLQQFRLGKTETVIR